MFLGRASVHDDIIDGDVERVIRHGGLDLVGISYQFFGAGEGLAQLVDGSQRVGISRRRKGVGLFFRDDGISHDFLVDFEGHDGVFLEQ